MINAIESLEKTPMNSSQLLNIIFGDTNPTFDEKELKRELKFLNKSLNPSQKEAVSFALSANEIALIHGPPGTGKTTTVIEIIWQLCQRGGDKLRILACGPSNVSVGLCIKT